MSDPDQALLARLGQLALVELGALTRGADGERRRALIRAHAGELADALSAARARADALVAEIGRPGGAGAARLRERAAAARALARLDEAAARLVGRLAEAEHTLRG